VTYSFFILLYPPLPLSFLNRVAALEPCEAALFYGRPPHRLLALPLPADAERCCLYFAVAAPQPREGSVLSGDPHRRRPASGWNRGDALFLPLSLRLAGIYASFQLCGQRNDLLFFVSAGRLADGIDPRLGTYFGASGARTDPGHHDQPVRGWYGQPTEL
jgi:hypothetical protein